MNTRAAHDMPAQAIDQRAKQTRRLTHHIGQGRAAEIDLLSRVLLRLPMYSLRFILRCSKPASSRGSRIYAPVSRR
jgi:hypothetical protein